MSRNAGEWANFCFTIPRVTIDSFEEEVMESNNNSRFSAVVDHIAVDSIDLKSDVQDYERIGFRLETLYDDWAMLRDSKGFGVALLGPGSKHPPHMGLRVETLEELQKAAENEGRTIKEHRDRSLSFYIKGARGRAVEVIYYPPDYRVAHSNSNSEFNG